MSNYFVAIVAITVLSIGIVLSINEKPFEEVSFGQPLENFGRAEKLGGSPATVGVLIKDASNADAILSEFVVEQKEAPCDTTATSTPSPMCTDTIVTYKGNPVSVYAVVPLSEIEKHKSLLLDTFPFAGQLHYKELSEADLDRRLIKIMEEKNSEYTILYDK